MITPEATINIVDNILNFPLIKHYSTLENIPLHTNVYYEMFYVKKAQGHITSTEIVSCLKVVPLFSFVQMTHMNSKL